MAEKARGGVYVVEESPYGVAAGVAPPKETFKFAASLLQSMAPETHGTLLDIGCANGAFIHYLCTSFPKWKFTGIDITPGFVEVANRLELPNASFHASDLFKVEGRFDVVTCIGTISMFDDCEPVLAKMLELCKPGGVVLADGFFNASNLDVKIEYRENISGQATPWHYAFNHFSRSRVEAWFSALGLDLQFHEVPFNVDLPRDLTRPSIAASAWTFRDESGKRILTTPMGVIANTTMLVAKNRAA